MPLLRCPDCKRILDSNASACPGCGYPVSAVINRVKSQMSKEPVVRENLKNPGEHTAHEENVRAYQAKQSGKRSSTWSIAGYIFIAGMVASIVAVIIWISVEAGKTRRQMETIQRDTHSSSSAPQ